MASPRASIAFHCTHCGMQQSTEFPNSWVILLNMGQISQDEWFRLILGKLCSRQDDFARMLPMISARNNSLSYSFGGL